MPCDLMTRPINNSMFFSIIEQKRRFPIGKRRHAARCRKNYSADSSSEDSAAEAASAAAISAAALASFSSLAFARFAVTRSEEHTSELQSRFDIVCRLLLSKK